MQATLFYFDLECSFGRKGTIRSRSVAYEIGAVRLLASGEKKEFHSHINVLPKNTTLVKFLEYNSQEIESTINVWYHKLIAQNIITKTSDDSLQNRIKIVEHALRSFTPEIEVYKQFLDFIGDAIGVAHNGSRFDKHILAGRLSKFKLLNRMPVVLDSLNIFRNKKLFPEKPEGMGNSLGAVYKFLTNQNILHQALSDANALCLIIEWIARNRNTTAYLLFRNTNRCWV